MSTLTTLPNPFAIDNVEYHWIPNLGTQRATASVWLNTAQASMLVVIDQTPVSDQAQPQLITDFRVRAAAHGSVPTNFLKREGRPNDAEILMSRLLDRSVRPSIGAQVTENLSISLLCMGLSEGADLFQMGLLGICLALQDAGINIPLIFGETKIHSDQSVLYLAVNSEGVVMLDAQLSEVKHEQLIQQATQGAQKLIQLAQEHTPSTNSVVEAHDISSRLDEDAKRHLWSHYTVQTKDVLWSDLGGRYGLSPAELNAELTGMVQARGAVGERIDSRQTREIRKVKLDSSIVPQTHGGALFSRGDTTAFVSATIGSARECIDVADLHGLMSKDNLFVHYNFYPFATNQGQLHRTLPNRREIGHGHLARKALRAVCPSRSSFPFAVRISSEILSADGSSSMATVTGASVALAAAGVPNTKHVVGISLGCLSSGTNRTLIWDLSEVEDHASDFDLKVAGTRDGLTAIQLDIKVRGIELKTFEEALMESHSAIHAMLDATEDHWRSAKRANLELEKRMTLLKIRQGDVGRVIGSGGKNLKALSQTSQCTLEVANTGWVLISGNSSEALRRAVHQVSKQSLALDVGRLYLAELRTPDGERIRVAVQGEIGYLTGQKLVDDEVQQDKLLVRYLGKEDAGDHLFQACGRETSEAHAVNGKTG